MKKLSIANWSNEKSNLPTEDPKFAENLLASEIIILIQVQVQVQVQVWLNHTAWNLHIKDEKFYLLGRQIPNLMLTVSSCWKQLPFLIWLECNIIAITFIKIIVIKIMIFVTMLWNYDHACYRRPLLGEELHSLLVCYTSGTQCRSDWRLRQWWGLRQSCWFPHLRWVAHILETAPSDCTVGVLNASRV